MLTKPRCWVKLDELIPSVRVCLCVCVRERLVLPLGLRGLSWQCSVELGDLAVDEGAERLFQLMVVPL